MINTKAGMDALAREDKKYRTAHLPTDEDKLAKLDSLLHMREHKGEYLLPDMHFYSLNLYNMAEVMLDWIGIRTKDTLIINYANDFESSGLKNVAGFYTEIDGIHYIYLNSEKVKNSYQAAAVLAHELMHYILMGIAHFKLDETLQNEKFTDIATVFTGLGIIVTNGFEFKSGWAETIGALMFGFVRFNVRSLSFGYYKPKGYAHMLKDFSDSWGIKSSTYAGYLLPWTRHFLPTSIKTEARITTNKSDTVRNAQKIVWRRRVISVFILLLILPISFLIYGHSGSTTTNVPPDVQEQLSNQKSQLDSLKSQYDSCSSDLNSRRNTVDQSDSAAVDEYNSELTNCNNIRDQYNSGVDSYNATVKQYQ